MEYGVNGTNGTNGANGHDPARLLILGAGASGLFAALTAAAQGASVVVVDHARKPGRKIAISGGGRCNVTNTTVQAADYCCGNPHFVKSALARWTPADMRQWLHERGVTLAEEPGGKLFCQQGAGAVVEALWHDARRLGVRFFLGADVGEVQRVGAGWNVMTASGSFQSTQLLIATGGLAWPQLGATGLGHDIARQFGLGVTPRRPGLVPLLFPRELRPLCQDLAGVSLPVRVQLSGSAPSLAGDMLFTHQGLSGPVILDASLFWKEGETLRVDFAPEVDLADLCRAWPRLELRNALAKALPTRLAAALCARHGWQGPAGQCSKALLKHMDAEIHTFAFIPSGTAGHGKAEVTLGGVDVSRIDSKTMRCKDLPGLFFSGEVLDVAGRLGGFNLHWAWASGHAAGMAMASG